MNESTHEYDSYYIARYTARNGDIYEGEYKVTGLLSFKTSTIDFESCRRGSGTASVFIHSATATRHSHQSRLARPIPLTKVACVAVRWPLEGRQEKRKS